MEFNVRIAQKILNTFVGSLAVLVLGENLLLPTKYQAAAERHLENSESNRLHLVKMPRAKVHVFSDSGTHAMCEATRKIHEVGT